MRKQNGFIGRILAVLLISVMLIQPVPAMADEPEDSRSQAAELPAQPVVKDTESLSEASLKISWEAVQDADYYYVYKKDEEGSFQKIGKAGEDTFYIDKSASPAKEAEYTVRSCKVQDGAEVLSENSRVIKARTYTRAEAERSFASPRLRKAAGKNATTVKIKWTKVKNAEGYYIYRKNAAGIWKAVGKVMGADSLIYLDRKCKLGKKYTYTVRAFRKYGSVTIRSWNYDKTGVTGTPKLTKPVLKSAKPVDNRSAIRTTWKKIQGVKGYYVYRRNTGSRKWRLLNTVKKAEEYTDKTVTANKDYTYTVRAFIEENGKTKLSRYDTEGVSTSTKVTSKTVDGLVLYYDAAGQLIRDTESIIGKQSSYALEIDYDRNIVTVYAKGSSGNYNVPVKAFVCSTGKATPIGTFRTPAKYRWRTLKGPCYGQWSTRIHGGVLFHSVPYYTQNNNNLKVYAYNMLGTKCSAGCVRLCCRDAKWIYDNCRLGTRVTIKHNAKNPFGKPKPIRLKSGHTWDPTDPNMAYKCRGKGCH